MAIRELFSGRQLTSFSYPITSDAASATPRRVPIELTKYAQEDTFDRILVHVSGDVVVTGASPGTATGAPNPEGILSQGDLQTTPQYNNVQPFNKLSPRSLVVDAAEARGYFISSAPIPDVAGTHAVDFFVEFYFKRPNVRKGIQWALNIQKYTSVLMNLNFGGRDQLFSGGTNTWDLSALSVEVFTDSDFAVNAGEIHAVETFEQTYTVTASQSDFPIDTLPPGFLYTDMTFLAEVNGALSDAIINNIAIEGGGRTWFPKGENNASFIRRAYTQPMFTSENEDLTGIYAIPLRDGMFTRGISALTAPITVKLDVTFTGSPDTNLIRLLCRRMVPGGVQRRPAAPPKITSGPR